MDISGFTGSAYKSPFLLFMDCHDVQSYRFLSLIPRSTHKIVLKIIIKSTLRGENFFQNIITTLHLSIIDKRCTSSIIF